MTEPVDGTPGHIVSPGHLAYNTYREHQGGKAFNGQPIPTWDKVREDIRRAWEAAAAAVREVAYNDGHRAARKVD